MPLTLFDVLPDGPRPSSSGKMSPACSRSATTPSVASSRAFLERTPPSFRHGANGRTRVWLLDPRAQSRGGSSTPNSSDWHNGAVVCSLSQVLEKGSIPRRYFLSSKACAGILRRAAKRGKTLPPALHQALMSVAATRKA